MLDRLAVTVERRPGHGQDGGGAGRLQQPGFGRRGPPGADDLLPGMQLDALAAQQFVQSGLLQLVGRAAIQQAGRQVVVHQGQRGAVGQPQPLDFEHRCPGGQREDRGELGAGLDLRRAQDRGRRVPVVRGQVVVQARQCHRAEDAGSHDHRAQAAAPDHQALLDQALHGLPDGGAAHAQPFGQVQLVIEPVPRFERPVFDRGLELLGDLEVQRNRAGPVERSLGHGASPACRPAGSHGDASSICPDLLT